MGGYGCRRASGRRSLFDAQGGPCACRTRHGSRAGVIRPVAAPSPAGVHASARGHVVLDTPAGLHGWRLADLIRLAGHVIVPLQPSMFDILATQAFLCKLADEKPVRHGEAKVGVVGMRVDMRTRAAEQLQRFVQGLQIPILGYLRDTQNYVQLAAHGLTLWDVAPSRVARDVEQWRGILDWVAPGGITASPDSM
ncbi:ParA family protein [Ralstonia pseudosolanacearum]|uniref:ParA family protein n=1 Tax=Ralstonia pseudosolanacearum TaxID=1310165 RepID=UPI003CEBB94C